MAAGNHAEVNYAVQVKVTWSEIILRLKLYSLMYIVIYVFYHSAAAGLVFGEEGRREGEFGRLCLQANPRSL
jgi:hypothetical protein